MGTVQPRAPSTIAAAMCAWILTCVGGQAIAADGAGAQQWSTPASLASCGTPSRPTVLFPSDSAQHASGPGAIVWDTSGRQCAGQGDIELSQVGLGDVPGAPQPLQELGGQRVSLAALSVATSVPHGGIALVGAETNAPSSADAGALTEGIAGGTFTKPISTAGPSLPAAAVTAYLGDAGVATLSRGTSEGSNDLELRVQRHYADSFGAPVTFSSGLPASSQIALALDFRSDALLAWRRGEELFARSMSNTGALGRIEPVAEAQGASQLVDLNSDDNRGMVAWTSQHGGETSVYLDISQTGYRFGSPQLLERYDDLEGLTPPAGSLRLIRLAEESVMMAWTGVQAGRYVVHVASVSLEGARPPLTVSAPNRDALLDELVPGPDNEVLALWSSPTRGLGHFSSSKVSLFAARGIEDRGAPRFDAPEQVSTPGPNSEVSLAFDPDSDEALAAWRDGAQLRYSVRSASSQTSLAPTLPSGAPGG